MTRPLPPPRVEEHARVSPLLLPPERAAFFDRWWPRVVGLAAGFAYAIVGYWLLHGLHYAIGDALVRTSAARSIVDSRNPHLSAIGFVWMPLPTFAQVPVTAVLSRLHWAAYSGMLTTALAGALTVPAIARIGQDLHVRRSRAMLLTLCYALNPFTVFYAANGMSEAWAALFTALAMRRFIAWIEYRRVRDLGGLGISLGLLSLCRYEGVAITCVIAIIASLVARRGDRRQTALVVALPTAFVIFCWSALCRILLNDSLFWLHGLDAVADPPPGASWLPATRNLLTVGGYAMRLTLIVAPALLIVVPLSLRKGAAASARLIPVGLSLVGAIYPLQVIATVLRGDGWGNLRYFSPLALIATVLVAWTGRTSSSGGWRASMLALMIGLITGYGALASPKIAAVEGEYAVTSRTGHDGKLAAGFPLDAFLGAVGYLDATTTGDDLIAVETSSGFAVTLFSLYPGRFAITQDTDYEQLVARQPTRFTWIVQVTGTREARGGSGLDRVLSEPPTNMVWNLREQFTDSAVAVSVYRLEPISVGISAGG